MLMITLLSSIHAFKQNRHWAEISWTFSPSVVNNRKLISHAWSPPRGNIVWNEKGRKEHVDTKKYMFTSNNFTWVPFCNTFWTINHRLLGVGHCHIKLNQCFCLPSSCMNKLTLTLTTNEKPALVPRNVDGALVSFIVIHSHYVYGKCAGIAARQAEAHSSCIVTYNYRYYYHSNILNVKTSIPN